MKPLTRKPIQKVLISVLNWNTADMSIKCADALLALELPTSIEVSILIIDNGSTADEYASLVTAAGDRNLTIHREDRNTGFAGGHNIAINMAIENAVDFIWLVNSDAIVFQTSTLARLVCKLNHFPKCGAVSPLIIGTDTGDHIDFCGAFHDWRNLRSILPATIKECESLQLSNALDMWVLGTAVLFRIEALKATGGLDERLFAYYEDDDIGARLAAKGWTSMMAYDARITHASFPKNRRRPPYYFYLMQRNYLMFWSGRTPKKFRHWTMIKLLDKAFFDVNRLYAQDLKIEGDAALLGINDFLARRHGAPELTRKTIFVVECIRRVFLATHRKQLKRVVHS